MRPTWAKGFHYPHLNRKKLGMVAHVCHPINGKKPLIKVQADPGKK
jgi:hypothetical protein